MVMMHLTASDGITYFSTFSQQTSSNNWYALKIICAPTTPPTPMYAYLITQMQRIKFMIFLIQQWDIIHLLYYQEMFVQMMP